MAGHFDGDAFVAALDRTREARKLTWRKVADQAGISASTLSRMQQGKRPDVDSLAALATWAAFDVDLFFRSEAPAMEVVPLAQVTAYLRADPNLSPEGAAALETIIQAAYKQFTVK
jgi:transcriptional regulator with XRE-family HTH domain